MSWEVSMGYRTAVGDAGTSGTTDPGEGGG